jgi:hypothetical protein
MHNDDDDDDDHNDDDDHLNSYKYKKKSINMNTVHIYKECTLAYIDI